MAAAAYAFVVSLWNTLIQLLTHPLIPACLETQIQSLCSNLSFLEDFLEKYSDGESQQAQVLHQRISLAACEAEHLIDDALMANQIRPDDSTTPLFLQEVTERVDSITEEVKKIWDPKDVTDQPLQRSEKPAVAESTRAPPAGETAMVGFEEQKREIIEMLTGEETSRQIISITGMGGAGKTTLATSIYTDLRMKYRFDILIWVTISQDYTMRDVLLQIPICQKRQAEDSEEVLSDVHLGQEVLRKSLWERRYLVVMDDLWSTDVWDDMQSFFPDNENHSRILVTTRLSKVAEHLGRRSVFELEFLKEDDSWKLFCQTAFKGGSCPPQLLDVGKKIVKECKGLPLSITVIAGLSGKSSWRAEHWERVARDVSNSILKSDDEDHCFRALSLSYTHLPTHLKPCFLYMGIFPEDYRIRATELVNLWIAEGFLKPNEDQTLEEVAEEYLDDLVHRNLILVGRRGSRRKISTCYIHDVMRELCLKVAQQENFFCTVKKSEGREITHGVCRIVSDGICGSPASSFTRSYFNFGWCEHKVSLINEPQIRVLSNFEFNSQEDLLGQVNMRYLRYRHSTSNFRIIKRPLFIPSYYICMPLFPSLVSQFWNLQTIIVVGGSYDVILGPPELWKMRQLRHVQVQNMYLEHPPPTGTNCVLGNLRTLKKILNFRWSPEVLKRVPFVNKLTLRFDSISFHPRCIGLDNLHLLTNLESLHIDFYRTHIKDWFSFKFPESLKKLSLASFVWDAMKLLCSLPSLRVLKLRGTVGGDKWSPIEVEFRVLEYLEAQDCKDLEYWNASSSEFPALRTLKFGNAPKLKEIPSEVGDIPTLELISIRGCQYSAAISALEILKEQEDFGNDSLQVPVELESKASVEILQKYMKDIGFTSKNFHFSGFDWTERSICRDCRQNIFMPYGVDPQRTRLMGTDSENKQRHFGGPYLIKERGERSASYCSRKQCRSRSSDYNSKDYPVVCQNTKFRCQFSKDYI